MQGHGRKEKQSKKKHKYSCRAYFAMRVRAKKNRNLAGMVVLSENAHKRTNMDDYGFRWVNRDAGARAQGKTTEKEAKIVVSGLFCDACQAKKPRNLAGMVEVTI